MPAHRSKTPLYVRLPSAAAEKLDRAAFELKATKQDLVAGLLSRYVDPGNLDELRDLAGGTRRVVVETADDTLTVGRHSFLPAEEPDVLTLAEAAELLRVEPEAVEALVADGHLPARKVAGELRFARRAVLDWLAAGEEA
jgi:excisionase family DNA binding protein